TSGGTTTFSAASTVHGNLTVTSPSGAISQAAPLTVDGATSFAAGASTITLTQANSLTGAVVLTTTNTTAGAAQLTNGIATNLGSSEERRAGKGRGLRVTPGDQ